MDSLVLFRIGSRACGAIAATGLDFDACYSVDGRTAIALFVLAGLACVIMASAWRRFS